MLVVPRLDCVKLTVPPVTVRVIAPRSRLTVFPLVTLNASTEPPAVTVVPLNACELVAEAVVAPVMLSVAPPRTSAEPVAILFEVMVAVLLMIPLLGRQRREV